MMINNIQGMPVDHMALKAALPRLLQSGPFLAVLLAGIGLAILPVEGMGTATAQIAAAEAPGPCEAIVANAVSAREATGVPPDLDRYIECEMRERQIPGLALAIVRNGEILTQRGYGLASIQGNAPVTPDTRFAIASVTKPITAIGIMLLVEDGKIELDAPVSRYLTEAPAAWQDMTVRHLLNHTSGLPEIGHGWAQLSSQDRNDLVPLTGLDWPTESLYRIALQDMPWVAPGTDWVYSDVGYFLLGVISERASGMSWRDFIRERVFEPVGMVNSYIGDGWTVQAHEARGYTMRNGVLSNIRRDRVVETPSHYGVFSSVGDLARLDAALYTEQLLNAESRRTMWAPTALADGHDFPYGLGWEVWQFRGHRTQYHGGITGAEFLRLPDESLAVVVLTNLGHGTRYGMSQNVAKLLVTALQRPALQEVPAAEADLHGYAGVYASLSGESFEVKLVDMRLVAPYPWPFPRRGGQAVLIHQGDHVFEFVDHDGRLVFKLAEDGTVTGLSAVAWDGGYRSDYKKTSPLDAAGKAISSNAPDELDGYIHALMAEIPDSVDAHIHTLMAERQIPGLSLVVVKEGRIIKQGHYGQANVELNVPVSENTSFMIASMSKGFTAAALMVLVDDGTLDLEDPVRDFLEELPLTWSEITIRQLLDCTAGIANDWDLHPPGANDFFLVNTTDEAFLKALADVPLLFTPGEAYHYAAGTFVVGVLIEKVSGMSYAEFMRTRIFEPLGMTETMINDASREVLHRASGYRVENGVLTHGRRISPAAEARGDVGVLTTALDLAKWDAAFRDTRLLSQSSLDAISTPARLNDGGSFPYGLGWGLWPLRGNRVMGHGGTFRTGYSSQIDRFIDSDLTVIALANLHVAFDDREIGAEIAGFYDPAYRLVSSMTPRPDPDADRSRMLRSVLGLVGSGIHDPERLTPGFPISAYTHSRWQERHTGLRSFTFVDCQDRSASGQASGGEVIREVCFYRFSDGQGAGYLVYSLAQDGKVADLYAEQFVPHPHGGPVDAPSAPADLAITRANVVDVGRAPMPFWTASSNFSLELTMYKRVPLVILSLTDTPLAAQPVAQSGFAERINAIFAEHDLHDGPSCAVPVQDLLQHTSGARLRTVRSARLRRTSLRA